MKWTLPNWSQLFSSELNSTELKWTLPNSSQLSSNELKSTELNLTHLSSSQRISTEINWTEMKWISTQPILTHLNRYWTQPNWSELCAIYLNLSQERDLETEFNSNSPQLISSSTHLNWTHLSWISKGTLTNSSQLISECWTQLLRAELSTRQFILADFESIHLHSSQLNFNSTEIKWTLPNSSQLISSELNSTEVKWNELCPIHLNLSQVNST